MEEVCKKYLDRWKDCKSLSSQFHSLYVYGERQNCELLKEDFDNCVRWTQDQTELSRKALLQLEAKVDSDLKNECFWELRTVPPPDWPKASSQPGKKTSGNFRITSAEDESSRS
ncbi:synaptic plasticity regulator PANTS-like [Diadema antillarum]|uniref:synaptic plasticity regulator PANTS-like n=1 Tax=Diadema antillarum TaxID=105358 RepID=UPI003A859B26